MPAKTETLRKPASNRGNNRLAVVLRTHEQVAAYKAKHLKPVRFGPKGQPIYDHEEVKALRIKLADPA